VVANGQTAEFRFFDADGTYLHSAGGRGRGPGELRELFNITLLPGDTLVAIDLATGDLDWFDPNGRFVRRSKVEFQSLYARPTRADVFWMMPDRSFLIQVYWDGEGPIGEPYRAPLHFVRWNATTSHLDTLGRYRGWTTFRIGVSAGPDGWMTPFSRATVHAISPDAVYIGDSESYQIDAYARDGRLMRIIRRRVPPRSVTEADLERSRGFHRERMERMPPPFRPAFERWLAAVPYEETLPAFYRLLVDADGRLWVLEAPSGDSTRTWSVFTREGRLLATIELPNGFFPAHGGADGLLGVWRDELGVEYVRLYRVNG
jgi:hypothetical protein